MKVLFLTTENFGVNFYRIWQPAHFLKKRGHEVFYTMDKKDYFTLMKYGYQEPIRRIDEKEASCKWLDENKDNFDLVVSTRSSNPHTLSLLLAIREAYDKPFIMDFDDNFAHVPKYNMAFTTNQPTSDPIRFCFSHLNNANAGQTPSKFLQTAYSRYNKIYHCPNFVDPEMWNHPQRQRGDGKIKIVVATAAGRWGDIQHIQKALEWALEKYKNVQVLFMGTLPDFALKYPRTRTFFIRWAHIPTWMKLIRYLNCDIGIAPLCRNDFNRSKSNLKYLDYAMAKIPGIYQKLDPYDCVKHGETGLVAKKKQDWKECLKLLIEDGDVRQRIRRRAYEDVMDNYTGEKVIGKYEQAYEEVISNGNRGKRLYTGQTEGLQQPSNDSRQDCRGE